MTMNTFFSARPADLWRAWTEADLALQWFGSDPLGAGVRARFDARLGGSYQLTFANADGSQYSCLGRYLEFQPFKTLKFSWGWANTPVVEEIVTLWFREEGMGTTQTLEHSNIDPHTTHDYSVGWGTTFEKLRKVLSALS